ncbi:hypothetical protein F2Q70_00011581 [Brassica cretica]|uniref:RNase H type-1 domain-containing protein n=1 Tax=Brassica cretica TaxID=69181 RepID=A0A8S9MBW3_BRACR|nr:hypothetical protein F2Q70_00011581 [Brassica cretica]
MEGMVKCNVNSKWRNSSSLSGGAWITRNQQGNVLHHTREAFTPSPNRLTAELRCIIWALQSVRDLGFQNVVIGVDNQDVINTLYPMLPLGHATKPFSHYCRSL